MPSCTSPWRCDEDSMPTPATAPPRVMVFSCGTTVGITPCARQARLRSSYGVMPSASTKPSWTESTWLKPRTSSRRRPAAARSRNRLEVSLASATGPSLRPLACRSDSIRDSRFAACAASASAMSVAARGGLRFSPVEELAAHRVARLGHVALGEHDLEQMRAAVGHAEHLGAAVQVHAPDAPEALVEALRIERADPLPVAVEALGPDAERERVVAPQVLDVEDLQAGLFHLHDHVGEARDPAAGEHVLADEEVGVVVPDVADEMDQPEPALLEVAGVRADQLAERVAPGVLEAADRHHLVELLGLGAEVGVHLHRILEAELLDLPARVLGLRSRGVDAGDADPVVRRGVHQEAAEARADVDHFLARLQAHLARDVVGLRALRLLERARVFPPVRAGVEHQRVVEPELVELGRQRVMSLGVGARARTQSVGMGELVPLVAQPVEHAAAAVDLALQTGGKRLRQAALDVEVVVEVGLEQPHVAESRDTPVGALVAEHQGEGGHCVARALLGAVRVAHGEGDLGPFADGAKRGLDQVSHGSGILPSGGIRGMTSASLARHQATQGVTPTAAKKGTERRATERRAQPRSAPRHNATADPITYTGAGRADVSPEELRKLISEAAYYRAKQRGFEPGHEVEDWVQAEAEVMRRVGARST